MPLAAGAHILFTRPAFINASLPTGIQVAPSDEDMLLKLLSALKEHFKNSDK